MKMLKTLQYEAMVSIVYILKFHYKERYIGACNRSRHESSRFQENNSMEFRKQSALVSQNLGETGFKTELAGH